MRPCSCYLLPRLRPIQILINLWRITAFHTQLQFGTSRTFAKDNDATPLVCCDLFVLMIPPQYPFKLQQFVASNAAGCDHISMFDHASAAGFRSFTSPAAFRAYVEREILSLEPVAP